VKSRQLSGKNIIPFLLFLNFARRTNWPQALGMWEVKKRVKNDEYPREQLKVVCNGKRVHYLTLD
jgi:hypothetical protein